MAEPYWSDEDVTLFLGDCLTLLPDLPDNSMDAIVTDPPYGLEFMGREWDGADGFRRSLNEDDAGRDSVFGRTSKTSPEYKTGKPSAARIRQQSERDHRAPECDRLRSRPYRRAGFNLRDPDGTELVSVAR